MFGRFYESKRDFVGAGSDANGGFRRWFYRFVRGIIVLTSILLTLVAFDDERIKERQKTERQFVEEAQNQCTALDQEIESSVRVVFSVKAFYDSSTEVTFSEFRSFASAVMLPRNSIQAIEWSPRVAHSEREKYEALRRQDGLPVFQFSECSSQGGVVAAGRREEYFPVYFIEPQRGNEKALGFDLSSEIIRNTAIRRAQETGEAVATSRTILVQETKTQYGFLLFAPVYRRGAAINSVEARREHLQGVVLGVFRVNDILAAASSIQSVRDIEIGVYDMSAPASERFLCSRPANLAKSMASSSWDADTGGAAGIRYLKNVKVADRQWLVVCRPTAQYMAAATTMTPWGILFVGLFFSATIGRFLSSATRRAELVQAIVNERTRVLDGEIIARIKAETELRIREERLNLAFRATQDGIWDWNMETDEVFYSSRWKAMLGYEDSEIENHVSAWKRLLHPDDLQRALQTVKEVLAGTSEYVMEFRMRHKDGHYVEILSRGFPLRREPEGPITRIVGTHFDLTERKQSEMQLAQGEKNLKTFFDTINEMLFVLDLQGNIIHTNKATLTRLEYAREELIGQSVLQVHQEGRREEAGRIARAMVARETSVCTVPLAAKDGLLIPVETRVVEGEWDGQPALFGVCKDLTELHQSEERFSKVFKNNPLPMAISSLPDLRFLEVNDAFVKATGYSQQEVSGLTPAQTGMLSETATVEKDLKAAAEKGVLKNYEFVMRDKSGELHYGVLTGEVIQLQNQRIMLTAMVDITKNKEAEMALRESEERLRSITDSAQDAILMMDKDGRVSYWNPAAERILGYTRDEALGQPLHEFIAPSRYLGAHRAAFPLFQQTGQGAAMSRTLDVAARRKDGKEISVQVSLSAIHRADGWHAVGVLRDVTYHKQMESLAQERQRILEMLAANSPQSTILHAIVTMSEEDNLKCIGSILLVDGGGRRLLLGAARGLPDFYTQAIDGLEIGDGMGSCGTAAFTGKNVIVEDVETHPSWTALRHLARRAGMRSCWSSPFFSVAGRLLGTVAIYHRDIHAPTQNDLRRLQFATELAGMVVERTLTLEKMELAANRLSVAVQAGGVGVWDYDVVNNKLLWDDQMFRLYGITKDQFRGVYEAWQHGVHPDDRQRSNEEIQSALRGEKEFNTEFRVLWPDGSVHDIRALAIVTRDADGKPARMIGTNWDITAQKRREIQLRTFMSAVEQAGVSVTITNAKRVIEYVNPIFIVRSGYTAAEVIGKTPRMLQSGAHPKEFYDNLQRTLEAGQIWHGEFCNRRKDGALYWESASIAPIRNEKGELSHYVAVKEDITERRRVAEELKNAKEAADAASKSKSQFLANMSHEIRTPMNAILGYAQLLQRDSSLPNEVKEKVDIINRSGSHLLNLINDVLEMAKIEAGRLQLNPAEFEVLDMLESLAAMFRLRAEAKEIGFELATSGEIQEAIVADEGKVRQVLANLLSNAVKFTSDGGVILRASLRQDCSGQMRFVAEVEDTGAGISAEEQGKLFQYFEQTGSGREAQAGTGLGLAISRQYARLMGGDITMTSKANKGSIFHFEIPVLSGHSNIAKKPAEARRVLGLKAGHPPVRVLVVDDSATNRNYLEALLRLTGFEMREAINGEEGVRVWEEWKPQLILMDVHMPVMDGYEATRRIRARPEGKTVRIFAVTADVLDESRRRIEAVGMDGFVSKPIKESDLFEMIRQYLGVDYAYDEKQARDQAVAQDLGELTVVLKKLPSELVGQMRAAAASGKMRQLRQLTQQVANYDAPLAKKLRRLADQYEHEALLKLLAQEKTQ